MAAGRTRRYQRRFLELRCDAGWELAGEFAETAATRAFLDTRPVDLAPLDIHMPCESGLHLARELTGCKEPPVIVFVTAHDGYPIEAFAFDYLLKPIDDEG